MSVKVHEVGYQVLNMRTRMPFRYGIASMTALPHLFVEVTASAGGTRRRGIAAEGLPPKWFTKDPAASFRDEVEEMLGAVRAAGDAALAIGEAPAVFDFWERLQGAQSAWARQRSCPPLLAGLGVSLIERALIDAACRAAGLTFAQAVHANILGIRLGDIHPELAGTQPRDLLPPQPLDHLRVRHTVGLGDPLSSGEVAPAERLDDGLPQALSDAIAAYGLGDFKVKLTGDAAQDAERLAAIASLLERARSRAYTVTLDGNEQFRDLDGFRHWWRRLKAAPALRELLRRVWFIEQPWHRDVALAEALGAGLRAWRDRPPIIIDESDAEIDSAARALANGYAGTSHKNTKGVFRGIANACLIACRRRQDPASGAILSGEDLANVGPVALLEDCAVMALLGIRSVERNGHHYFRGLSMFEADVQEAVLAHHGTLYRRHPGGFATLDIKDGLIEVTSVVGAPFGPAFAFDPARYTPLARWRFASLEG